MTNEVIDIWNKKFYDRFINNDQGLSEPAKLFRQELLNSLMKQSKKRKRDGEAIDEQEELSRSIPLSSTFGKMDFKLEKVQEFAERIADILCKKPRAL